MKCKSDNHCYLVAPNIHISSQSSETHDTTNMKCNLLFTHLNIFKNEQKKFIWQQWHCLGRIPGGLPHPLHHDQLVHKKCKDQYGPNLFSTPITGAKSHPSFSLIEKLWISHWKIKMPIFIFQCHQRCPARKLDYQGIYWGEAKQIQKRTQQNCMTVWISSNNLPAGIKTIYIRINDNKTENDIV